LIFDADSDGKIDRFISPEGHEAAPVLPLHELHKGEPYLLAMFLTGVYQEVRTARTVMSEN
jgi:arginine decarboxylase